MCFYSRQTKKAIELINRYNARIVNDIQLELTIEYNGFTNPKTPVILNKQTESEWINGHAFKDFAHPQIELVTTVI